MGGNSVHFCSALFFFRRFWLHPKNHSFSSVFFSQYAPFVLGSGPRQPQTSSRGMGGPDST